MRLLPVPVAGLVAAAAATGFRLTDLDRNVLTLFGTITAAVIVKLIDGRRDRRRDDMERRYERLIRENQRLKDERDEGRP